MADFFWSFRTFNGRRRLAGKSLPAPVLISSISGHQDHFGFEERA
jgi:hypothetical protein